MKPKSYNNQVKLAEKQVKKIDKFISELKEENILFAGLLAKRLLNHCEDDDIKDIAFELQLSKGYEFVEIKSLPAQMAFDEFKQQLEYNPYSQPRLNF